MLHLLLGRALMRWLDKIGDETPPASATGNLPVAELASPALEEAAVPESRPPQEWVYPRLQRRAMGSLFEVYLAGTDREALVAAGNEALDEVERLERQLSHYRDDSDIARLNVHATQQWVRLEPILYDLLKRCCELSTETGGAFDITAGPLIKAWGFFRGEGCIPSEDELAEIMENVGSCRILFDDEDHLVLFTAPKLEINLGAVGKGYAMDAAAKTLHYFGVESAVIHGGQSTIYALGEPPAGDEAMRRESDEAIGREGDEAENQRPNDPTTKPPNDLTTPASSLIPHPSSLPSGWPFQIKDPRDRDTVLETVYLKNEALSTSGNYEQFFEVDGLRYSHIIDPRTGRPTHGVVSVSVIAPSAADSDALSTAFFVLGRKATEEYCKTRPNIRVIMIEERAGAEIHVTKIGFEPPARAESLSIVEVPNHDLESGAPALEISGCTSGG